MPLTTIKHIALAGICVALLLGGCAGAPQPDLRADNWQQQRQRLAAEPQWQLRAKVGVKSPAQNASANLNWQQQAERYDINLSGPLGQGSTWIRGDATGVVLEQSGKPPIRAASADALLYRATGISAPLTQLNWWIRGLPAPDQSAHISTDAEGNLSRIEQAGWQLDYSRFQHSSGYWLPGKIVARQGQIKLILITKQWHIGPAE